MKKLILGLAIAALAAPIHLMSGCGSDTSDNPTVDADAGPEGGATGAGAGAAAVGETCQNSLDCGTRNCDGTTKTCVAGLTNCAVPDAACTVNTDCCSGSCIGLKCTSKQCTADNAACAADGECCGGKCTTGKCVPLSTTCKTAGNPCAANGDCCSKYCKDGLCASSPSFCVQSGDACGTDANCCGGKCTKAAGATLGLCGLVEATGGVPGCTPAGQVCGAATTGGTLPSCGGDCCSRSCRPYAASGVLICQPPSGCHPTGELCRADADCCGSPGMPGSTDSSGGGKTTDVHCEKAAGATLGRCDNGKACSAAGSICRLATNSCDATDRCCSGTVQTHPLNCKQDALGIPRCTAASDVDCTKAPPPAGTACASGADCCGRPCVPNAAGTGFVCSATACVPVAGACSTTADCCAGSPCILDAGSSKGKCGASRVGTTTDAGTTGSSSGGTSGGTATPPAPGSTTCAQYGQVCTQTSDCCDAVPCTFGHCEYPDTIK
jgi:hypothetical protein